MNKKVIVLIIFLVIILGVLILLNLSIPKAPAPISPQPSASILLPSPEGTLPPGFSENPYSQKYQEEAQKINQESQGILDRNNKISNFNRSLPYKGQFFSAEFNYDTAKVVVTLDPSKRDQANQEFDEYLKSFGVESRDWINFLEIR